MGTAQHCGSLGHPVVEPKVTLAIWSALVVVCRSAHDAFVMGWQPRWRCSADPQSAWMPLQRPTPLQHTPESSRGAGPCHVQAGSAGGGWASALPPGQRPATVLISEAHQQPGTATGMQPQQPGAQQLRHFHPLYPQPKEDTFPDVMPLTSPASRPELGCSPRAAMVSSQPPATLLM